MSPACWMLLEPSIPDGESSLHVPRELDLIDQRHGIVLTGNSTLTFLIDNELIPTQAETTCALPWGDHRRRTEVGPVPVRGTIKVESLPMGTNHGDVVFREARLLQHCWHERTIGSLQARLYLEAGGPSNNDQAQ